MKLKKLTNETNTKQAKVQKAKQTQKNGKQNKNTIFCRAFLVLNLKLILFVKINLQ